MGRIAFLNYHHLQIILLIVIASPIGRGNLNVNSEVNQALGLYLCAAYIHRIGIIAPLFQMSLPLRNDSFTFFSLFFWKEMFSPGTAGGLL